ncbi:MAG: RNB domain-containing ribonuclease [Deltaproteobacteria bacterium]|jgi:exoribonuclease-2|nr:RNB domain-containing ribonuclease [Deltaproteobacteria bacterium]
MIVELLDNNEFLTAWVQETLRGRLVLLTSNGRSIKASAQRILISSEHSTLNSPHEIEETLHRVNQKRQELADSISMQTLYSILEHQGDTFSYLELADLHFGNTDSNHVAAMMRAVHQDGIYFKFSPSHATKQSEAEKNEGLALLEKEQEIIHFNETAVELFQKARELSSLSPPKLTASPPLDLPEHLVQILHSPKLSNLKKNLIQLSLVEETIPRHLKYTMNFLTKCGYSSDPDGAFEALMAIGVYDPDEDLDLLRLGLTLDFSPEILAETAKILEEKKYLEIPRMDLTDELILSVDSEGATEFDDALSLKLLDSGNMRLGIHVSDISAVIPPNTLLDAHAFQRGATIYVPDKRYPMLPQELTDKVLSLNENDIRPAFSIFADVDSEGNLEKLEMAQSLIKVRKNLFFSQADQILQNERDPYFPLLNKLSQLAIVLKKKRFDSGAMSFNLPVVKITVSPQKEIEINQVPSDTPANIMVEELMIFGNHLVALNLSQNNYPCAYRFQQIAPSGGTPELFPDPTNDRERLVSLLNLKRRLTRAGVSAKPNRHNGLGLNYYTYFTSPIRRHFDFLIHRQLQALVRGEPPFYDKKEIIHNALASDELNRSIHRIQNSRLRYWILKHLSTKVGETFTALAFQRFNQKVRLCLTEYMFEFEKLNLPEYIQPGDLINLRLLSVLPREKTINFVYLPETLP